jgi:hypothetical protein
MTLDEAIKILKSEQKHGVIVNMDNWNSAIGLGIEGLIAVKYVRQNYPHILPAPLPGETKEASKSKRH